MVLVVISVLIVALVAAQLASIVLLLHIDDLRNQLIVACVDIALTSLLLFMLATHLHFLNRERRRNAIIEMAVDALSVPASIDVAANTALNVLIGSGVARAGIVAVVHTDEDGSQRLHPVALAGTRVNWTPEAIAAEHLDRTSVQRQRVAEHPWLTGMQDQAGQRPWVLRAPLTRGDEELGVLLLASKGKGWLGDARLIRTASASLAAALDHGRQYQAAFERTRDLEDQNARRREFLYAIAHELRSPLTSIQAFAELLETDRTLIDSDNDLLLSSLSRGVDRLATFVNDLLDLGRVESGLRVTVGTMDVTEALRGAETMLRPSFMSREQALSLEIPEEPLRAIGDERALEQVMLNLLSNANRFTPARGSVTVRAVTQNGPASTRATAPRSSTRSIACTVLVRRKCRGRASGWPWRGD